MSTLLQNKISQKNQGVIKIIRQAQEIFQDVKKNDKYKESHTKVMQFFHSIKQNYQFTTLENDKVSRINLQPQIKVNIEQLLKKTEQQSLDHSSNRSSKYISNYDSEKILITKAYKVVKRNLLTKQELQRNKSQQYYLGINTKASNIGESVDVATQQVLVLYYGNILHVIKHEHENLEFQIEKSNVITAPTIHTTQSSKILIQPHTGAVAKKFSARNSNNDMDKVNFQHLSTKLNQSLQSYQQLIEFKSKLYQDDVDSIEHITKTHLQIKSLLYELLTVWHDQLSDVRVVLIDQSHIDMKNKSLQPTITNIFFYEPFQVFYSRKAASIFNINLKPNLKLSEKQLTFTNLILSARLVKQLLLYQLIATKNQPNIDKFKTFQKKLQHQLFLSLSKKMQQAQIAKKKRIQRIKDTKSLKNYQNLQIKNLFINWNQKIKQQLSDKVPFISIQLNSMYLITEYKYLRMKCEIFISYIDRKNKQHKSNQETKYFAFLFDENTEDWNVKLVPEESQSSKINVLFQLQKVSDFFNLIVKITPESKNNCINGMSIISKRQKINGFGENQQLVLYEQDRMGNERIVGFLRLFYLVKDYVDYHKAQSFDLHKYKNIKVLQTMPRIPANYFEHTLVNYNPNELKLFSQIIGYKKSNLSRENFERIYLKLIEFLQSERMDQRRESMIMMVGQNGENTKEKASSNKQRAILPYERMHEYEKIMRVKLAREAMKGYNGINYIHYIDAKNRITKSETFSEQQTLDDGDLIGQFTYLSVRSDELSMKTSLIINQSLKQSMYQSQVLFVNKAHSQTMSVMSTIFSLNENSLSEYKGSIYRTNLGKEQRRLRIQKLKSKVSPLQVFNPFMVPLINRIITLYKHHQSEQLSQQKSNSNIDKQTTTVLNSQFYHQPTDQSQTVEFAINFLNNVYPYSQPKALQNELMYVRYFVMKYLPQLSFQLNRKNIGLENFVTKYLLSLFTVDLQEQVTFQIWDFIMLASNKFAARINSVLTLLIFIQKNNFTPIIPLDTFTQALKQNSKRFDFSYNAKKVSELMISSLGILYEKQHARKMELSKMRNNQNKLLMGEQFVKKVLFDTERANKVSYQKNKVNVNDLHYKLPQPKYYGHPVTEIQLLIKGFTITQTVSINNWIFQTKWHNQSFKIKISEKSQILNSYIKFQYPKYLRDNLHEMPNLQFVIYPQDIGDCSKERYFVGCLNVMGLHKDTVYCEEVKMVYVKNDAMTESNKGQNVLDVRVILKSDRANNQVDGNHNAYNNSMEKSQFLSSPGSNLINRSSISASSHLPKQSISPTHFSLNLQKEYFLLTQYQTQQVYSQLLDYDISQQSNSFFKSIEQLKKQMIKMKSPIDLFSLEKYEQLKIPHCGDWTFPQIVMNSQLVIEELQALIQSFGTQNKLKTLIPVLYKLYAERTNYQMIFLTEILIESILIDNAINFQTKIEYLYLVAKHYQNCSSKGLTSQTVDFLFSYIYKVYGWLNPIPYNKENKGSIIKAIIYTKGIKNNEDILDFTQILQDSAHLNKIKYGHYSIVLGNAQYLTQLRELFPLQTLQKLQKINNNKEIKIEITYKKNNSQYLYSADVNLADFKIIEQGGKFLSKKPVNRELNAGEVTVHHQYCSRQRDQLFDAGKSCTQSSQTQPQCHKNPIQLDSSSEILYNCSNIISLESPSTFDRMSFRKAIYTTPMISYLLGFSSIYEPLRQEFNKKTFIPRSPVIRNQEKQMMQFKDWVLYRYQYCQQEWRRCKVEKIEEQTVFVKFRECEMKQQVQIKQVLNHKYRIGISQDIYCRAAQFQVWSMQENLVQNHSHQQTESIITSDQNERRHNKQAMQRLFSQTKR